MKGFFSHFIAKVAGFIAGISTVFMPAVAPPSVPAQPVSLAATTSIAAKSSAGSTKASPAKSHTVSPHQAESAASAPTSVESASGTETTVEIAPVSDAVGIKGAVVNVICISRDNSIPSMTASGVVIDPRGVILTNAHVAQYFLLSNYMENDTLRCVVRVGNPAKAQYGAELIYLPSKWLEGNAASFTSNVTEGTGEDDFALLRITADASGNSISDNIPYLPYSTDSKISQGETIAAAAYPAEFIPTADISTGLYDLSISTSIAEVLTFHTSTIDLFSMRGSVIAQRGSSGGAVVDSDGKLIGIITTASSKFYDNERNLYAITIPYIDRELKVFTGGGLDDMLSGNISRKAIDFSINDAPKLRTLLESHISSQ